MPFSTVDDVRLYWERVGDPDGPPVLFVNGTGGDLRARPSPLEGPLADGFDLVGYDQRGLGQSDKPEEATRWRATPPTRWDWSTRSPAGNGSP